MSILFQEKLLNKSVKLATFWTILFFVSSFAKTIILTPLMLSQWGKGMFSYWVIILSARSIILFLSDGYVRYVVNQYNLFFHADETKANKLLASGISFLLILNFAICIIVALIFWWFPNFSSRLFGTGNDSMELNLFAISLIVFLFSASIQNIQRMCSATKEARGLVWQNMIVEIFLMLNEVMVISILLIKEYKIMEVVLWDSVMIFFVSFLYIVHLILQYPIKGVFLLENMINGAQNFSKATQLYTSNFFEKLTTDGLVLLLSFFRFDKAAIALFATVRTLVNTPLLAQNLLLNSYTPEMQKLFSLRDSDGLRKFFNFIRLRIGLLLLLGIVLCLPLYEPVFVYWTKGKIDYNEPFMLTMLAMAVFNLYGLSFAFVLKGVNALPQMLGIMCFKSVLLLAAFVLLSPSILHFAFALFIIEIISSAILLPYFLKRYAAAQTILLSNTENIKQFLPYLLAVACLFLWYYF